MKRIFSIVICTVLLLCILPVSAFAEGDSLIDVEQSGTVTENLPIAEETATEGKNSASTEEAIPTITDMVVGYVQGNLEEISVIITLILTAFYQMRKHKLLNKSIGTLNNNAVTVSENSQDAIQQALEKMGGVSSTVTGYKENIESIITEYRANSEEKKKLEQTLADVHTFLKTAKLANIELANEVAELLVLANIPNAKKEELYSRHLAAVGAIADAEKTEVITHDNGQEAE